MRRCRHRWEEAKRYFVPPVAEVKLEQADADLVRDLLLGLTVVELRCRDCGDVESRTLPGNAT